MIAPAGTGRAGLVDLLGGPGSGDADEPDATGGGDAFAALLALVGAALPGPAPVAPAVPGSPTCADPLTAVTPPPTPIPNPGASDVDIDVPRPPVRELGASHPTDGVVELTQLALVTDPQLLPRPATTGSGPASDRDPDPDPVVPIANPGAGVVEVTSSAHRGAPVRFDPVTPAPDPDADPGASGVVDGAHGPLVGEVGAQGEGEGRRAVGPVVPAAAGLEGLRAPRPADLAPVDVAAPVQGSAPAVPAQLVEHVQALDLHEDGSHELTIALEPVELGRVELKVRVTDGVVHVHVDAGRVATADLVRQAAPDLRGAIESAGLSLGSFVAGSSNGQGRAGSGGGAGPGPGGRDGSGRPDRTGRTGGSDPRSSSHPLPSVGTGPGRVDLSL